MNVAMHSTFRINEILALGNVRVIVFAMLVVQHRHACSAGA